jgi:transposase InsO family protein
MISHAPFLTLHLVWEFACQDIISISPTAGEVSNGIASARTGFIAICSPCPSGSPCSGPGWTLDNGSEFLGQMMDLWAYHHGVQIDFSRPAKPTDNAFAESFNGSFRDECLNVHWFESLEDAREKIEAWRIDYNDSRPHTALKEMTPTEYALKNRVMETDQVLNQAGS